MLKLIFYNLIKEIFEFLSIPLGLILISLFNVTIVIIIIVIINIIIIVNTIIIAAINSFRNT